jgi:hypothetical protein
MFPEQFGVASSADLRRAGISRASVRAQVAARRWQHLLHSVYATFTGPLSRQAQLMAAVLYAGSPVALSHDTAAEEWNWSKQKPGAPIHLTVPYMCSVRSISGAVVLHRSRAFHHIVIENWALPRTSKADTMIDLAVAQPDSEQARSSLLAVAGIAGVTPAQLLARLDARKPRRYEMALREAVRLYSSGICSALEHAYATLVEEAHGIPSACRQVPVRVDGRTLYEDATYDHIGVPLTVRLDGQRYHCTPGVTFRDRRRDNAAELLGRHRLTYGWRDVNRDPCGVAYEVAVVLRRGGWTGALRSCGVRCEYFRSL